MSAFKYLAFVTGVVLVAVFGAFLNEFVLPFITATQTHSTTQASSKGVQWFSQFWEWIALLSLLLLAFALIVAVVNRRRLTVG